MPKMRTDDGVELNYRVDDFRDPWITEPGDTIIMSHAFSRSMKFWTQWVPALSRKYSVLRYDVRGCGESSVPPEGTAWSADRMAMDALNLIDHLDIQKVHWVGWGSGGLWGKVFAINHPGRIKSLTLVNTPSAMTRRSLTTLGKVRDRGSEAINKIGFKQWLEQSNAGRLEPSLADHKITEWHTTEQSKTPTEVAAATLQILETLDLSGKYPMITAPTLMMVGDRFHNAPLNEQAEVRNEIPNARLVVFPDIGGGIQLLIPDRCTDELLRFLDTM